MGAQALDRTDPRQRGPGPRARAIVGALVALLAIAGCTGVPPGGASASHAPHSADATQALPLCESMLMTTLGRAPLRAATVEDEAEVEAAMGFALPAEPRCAFVDDNPEIDGVRRVVGYELGDDRYLVDEIARRLQDDGWRNITPAGPPALERDGVQVQPVYMEWSDEQTGLQSMQAIVFVYLP